MFKFNNFVYLVLSRWNRLTLSAEVKYANSDCFLMNGLFFFSFAPSTSIISWHLHFTQPNKVLNLHSNPLGMALQKQSLECVRLLLKVSNLCSYVTFLSRLVCKQLHFLCVNAFCVDGIWSTNSDDQITIHLRRLVLIRILLTILVSLTQWWQWVKAYLTSWNAY
jgi:hypothetical protein